MQVDISYGCTSSSITIPDDSLIDIVKQKSIPTLADSLRAIDDALAHPYGTLRLRELAKTHHSAIVMVTDFTRILPYDILLPPVMNELEAGGIRREDILILVGSGTHRPMTHDELVSHLGSKIVEHYRVCTHEWWKPEMLTYLGTTRNKTPIFINRMLLDYDLKVAVGTIKPHRDAGWSGGAKMIQPGVSGLATTGATHWLAAHYKCEEILGKIDNPVRREMEEIAAKVGLSFILNCVQDDSHRLCFVTAGHFKDAHEVGVRFALPYFSYEYDEEADIFIAGTSPVQQNMWSIASGPNWAEMMTKHGGTIIGVGECSLGVCEQHPEIEKFGYLPFAEVEKLVDSGQITDLAAASHIHHGGEKIYDKDITSIFISNHLTRAQIEGLHFQYGDNLQASIDEAVRKVGDRVRIFVYPGFDYATLIPVRRKGLS
jgi:nickel-dependent lactate racemase